MEKQDQTFPQRLKKKKKMDMNVEKTIINTHTHRSEVRPQFFPSEGESFFSFQVGGKKRPSALVLSSCLQTGSQKNKKKREEDRKYPSLQLYLCPFSLSGAGNLPRNVREH